MTQQLPSHVQWLATHRGQALQRVLDAGSVRLDVPAALAVLRDADPDRGAHAVQWLLDALLSGGLLWEDVAGGATSKAAQTLRLFSQHRRSLPPGQRNLEDHSDLGGVYLAIQPMLADADMPARWEGARDARRARRAGAYADSIIVHSSAGLVVAVPTTRTAACWWGQGTRWCTAADQHNRFDDYHARGPLVVVVPRGVVDGTGRQVKLQLHVDGDGRVQFMDEADRRVAPDLVHRHWRRLEPLVTWMLGFDPGMLDYVPAGQRTPAMYLRALAQGGLSLGALPEHMRDKSMCGAALQANPAALRWVPPHLLDPAMCMSAVTRMGRMLEAVPAQLQTPAMCRRALMEDGGLLGHVANRTPRLCWTAIRQNGAALAHVPAHLVGKSMCRAAVGRTAGALAWVPRELRTRSLCWLAVRGDGNALRHVPQHLVTRQMIVVASATPRVLERVQSGPLRHLLDGPTLMTIIKRHPERIAELGPALHTGALCRAAVRGNPTLLLLLPMHMRTNPVCSTAVWGAPMILEYVPAGARTRSLCRLAVAADFNALVHVPVHMRSRGLCALALAGHLDRHVGLAHGSNLNTAWAQVHAFQLLPASIKTREVCLRCVAIDPQCLRHVPRALLDRELCLVAIKASPVAIRLLPPAMLDYEMCLAELEWGATYLCEIDHDLRTPELCTIAVDRWPGALAAVPQALRTLEMCTRAVQAIRVCIELVPDHLRQAVEQACMGHGPPQGWSPGMLDGLQAALDRHALDNNASG